MEAESLTRNLHYYCRERVWHPLKGYLDAMSQDQSYKFYDFALEKMMDHGGTALPWWVVQRYEVTICNVIWQLSMTVLTCRF